MADKEKEVSAWDVMTTFDQTERAKKQAQLESQRRALAQKMAGSGSAQAGEK